MFYGQRGDWAEGTLVVVTRDADGAVHAEATRFDYCHRVWM